MRALLFITFCISIPGAKAQSPAEEDVRQIVLSVFEGMRTGDSTMVSAAFSKEAHLYTVVRNKEGETVLHEGSLQKFLNAIGSPRDQVWNELVWDMEIRIDEGFAQVWTPYAFYLDNQFSHCGVDAFHLVETSAGWKIFQITDTRKKQGCKVPEAIKKKYQ